MMTGLALLARIRFHSGGHVKQARISRQTTFPAYRMLGG
jgi:hypothetical protein